MKSLIVIVILLISFLTGKAAESFVLQVKCSYQSSPSITNVSAVASDVLCIEVDACRLIPGIYVPYRPDSLDVITTSSKTALGETRGMGVKRNGSPLGWLVGWYRKTIWLFERVVGKHLNTASADSALNYLISSTGDADYKIPVSPEKIWRKTKPTDWTIDSGEEGTFYTAKHFLFLKLPYRLKTGQTYFINLPKLNLNRSSIYYVHDPVNIRSEAVHVSQIGFRADDPYKNAYLSVWMGNGGGYNYPENLDFSIIDDNTNQKVFNGKAAMQWKGSVPEGIGTNVNHSGTDVICLDFSSFCIPGRYRICVEGIGCGYPFNIGESTWEHAFLISMKGHYNQRSGIPMGPPYTDFVRPRSFRPEDGVVAYQSTCSLMNSGNGLNALGTDKNNFGNLCAGKTDKIVPDAWGGTMDAGDFDRRIQHLAAPRLYLELLELHPEYFRNISLNIPESGNDLPDIVDESLYGLDVYRRLQMPDGGIRGGIESSEHPAGELSYQPQMTTMVYAPDPWSSYIYAGVAARASLALKTLGKTERAEIWRTSALKAMEWAETEYAKWTSSPDYAKFTERAKNTVPVERNLAAVELYRLTNDKRWNKVYISTRNMESNRTEAAFVYARIDKSLTDKKIRQEDIDHIITLANQLVEISGKSTYGITTATPGRALGSWESNYSIPASQTLVRAHYLTGDIQYLKTIVRSALFSAGANPMNLCLTTGLGINNVIHPLHIDSRNTGQDAPVGITVCGPCEVAVYGKPTTKEGRRVAAECTPAAVSWPSAESYFDVYRWASMNEYTVDGNMGPTAYIWGYLAARGGAGRGALSDYNWSELSQAKWDTRRMLGNLGHDIECSIFSLIDLAYTTGPIHKLNYKGIIKSDSTKKVIRPKIAYYAIQNVTSVFDNSLERIKELDVTYNISEAGPNDHKYSKSTDRSLAVYGYRNKITKNQVYSIWMDENIPGDSNITKLQTFSFSNANFDYPVFVDIITGGVYDIPADKWSKTGNIYTFREIPVYDGPILISDRSLIKLR